MMCLLSCEYNTLIRIMLESLRGCTLVLPPPHLLELNMDDSTCVPPGTYIQFDSTSFLIISRSS
jgi:hypothetical protein